LGDAGYKVVAVMFFGEKEAGRFFYGPRPLVVPHRIDYEAGEPIP